MPGTRIASPCYHPTSDDHHTYHGCPREHHDRQSRWQIHDGTPPPSPRALARHLTPRVQNKTLTETAKTDEILRLQGVGWLTRKALSVGTLTLAVRQYADDAGVEHIDIDQTLTGGIPGSREERTLDWEARERADPVFGHVVGRTRRARVDEPEEPFLKKDWLPDTAEHKLVESYVESDTPKSK